MGKEIMYKNLSAFHPGSYVEDIIDELNITQAEFAERLGVSAKTISKIVNGEEKISTETANKLAKLTGISLKTWLNLQSTFEVKLIEIKNMQDTDEREVCNLIDFSYFKKNGFIDGSRYLIQEKIAILRKLLNLSNLSSLYEFKQEVSYRKKQDYTEKSIVNSNIMLELAMNISRDKTDKKYTKEKLEKILPDIRKMTLEQPNVFYPELKRILLESGIVLVSLPKLKNAGLNGATKKFKNGSVLLLMTDYNKTSDIFWFSLMHELGHIYNEDFYSNYIDKDSYSEKEDKADNFAMDFFIPREQYNDFVNRRNFSRASILNMSEQLKIHPSILLGRLQKNDYLPYSKYCDLKEKYNVIINITEKDPSES